MWRKSRGTFNDDTANGNYLVQPILSIMDRSFLNLSCRDFGGKNFTDSTINHVLPKVLFVRKYFESKWTKIRKILQFNLIIIEQQYLLGYQYHRVI